MNYTYSWLVAYVPGILLFTVAVVPKMLREPPPLPTSALSRMQLNLHATRRTPHGALRLVQQATSAWSVKIRRAPSRRCKGARVCGHTTTGHDDYEYTPTIPCKHFDSQEKNVCLFSFQWAILFSSNPPQLINQKNQRTNQPPP